MDAPLPLNIDLTAINKNTGRILEFRELKRQIRPLIVVLNKVPETDIEKAVMVDNSVEDCSNVGTEMFEQAQNLLEQLKGEVANQADRANKLWTTALTNWNRLNERSDPSLQYTNARSGIIHILESLCNEQEKAEESRLECIRKSIFEMREELVEMWRQCMVTSEEREYFVGFRSTDFTSELLDLHRAELVKWKSFHKKNQTLFTYIEKRQHLWKRMKELQAKSEDPNRFINRGGTLLQSQKEMNYVSSALPKCEEKLTKLAQTFEKENGRKLLILGKPIPEIIAQDWVKHKESIKNKSAKPPLSRTSIHPHGTRSSCKPPPQPQPLTGEKRIGTYRSRTKLFAKKGKLEIEEVDSDVDDLDLINAESEDQENVS